MFRNCILITLCLLTTCISSNALAETVAEYTSTSSNGLRATDGWAHAMAFDVASSHDVTEVQMVIARWSGSTQNAVMQLRSNAPGTLYEYYDAPSSTVLKQISVPVTNLPYPSTWFSFKWPSGQSTTITAGKYWIVLKPSSGSDATIDWIGVAGNPYENGIDTLTSKDGGSSWTIIQGQDMAFRVFGSRVPETTTTTVTATPSTVTVGGGSTINVEVRDSGAALVQGPGTVTLTKTGGTLDKTSLTLVNGKASAVWTAPASPTGNYTVTGNYQAHSFAGVDYAASNDNASITVIAENRSTTTTQTLTPNSTTTRSSITVSVDVKDNLSLPVTGGSVSLSCSTGTFATNPIVLAGGSGSTTWTASNNIGAFTIKADYSGFNAGAIIYGASNDSDNVSVDYTNVTTNTTVTVTPNYPYVYRTAYVIVDVKDTGGNSGPGGTVQLSAPSGWFTKSTLNMTGGRGNTLWTAPAVAGAVTITANYQQYLAGGNKYLASSDNDIATVVKDTDSDSGWSGLSRMGEWNTNYSNNPLSNTDADVQGFINKLTSAMLWGGSEYYNTCAKEDHMKKSSKGGQENDYMDVHDFTYYSGHGNPDYATFITNKDDKQLKHSDAYDAWGTNDCEWVVFSACQIMSKDSYWASTMNGIHTELGWHTNMMDSATFGGIFASLLIREGVDDAPHKIHQAFFLAGDQTHPNTAKQRVISETSSMRNDYIWGQGYVSPDPTVDSYYSPLAHDVASQSPVADAGGPYNTTAGVAVRLDASATTDADVGGFLYYAWDLDTASNDDPNDWDHDDTDEVDDDADVWGRRPWVTFDAPGVYTVRLMVIDNTWNGDTDSSTVTVTAPAPAPPLQSSGQTQSISVHSLPPGSIEIVDNTNPVNWPTETQMPFVQMVGTTIGYNEMMNIADYYGMSGSATMDGVGNWNMVNDNHELIVNQYSGNVMFVDRGRAYIYYEPTVGLPSEGDAITRAEEFLSQNGITCPDLVVESVTDISAGEGEKGSRTPPSRTPFLRRVNFRRQMNVLGTLYPVVGPGGRITVMMTENPNPEVIMFTKICRHAYPDGPEEPMISAVDALIQFQNLGPKALTGASRVPPCNRIDIENISLGYYEDDFVTLQTTIRPVYILDLTCEDEVGSQQVQVYMSALAPPLEAAIDSPFSGKEIDYGDSISFTGSVAGGMPPYTYEWASDVDGLLGNGPNVVTSSLSVHSYSESCVCRMLPHTVSFTVTDAHGSEASDFVEVKVEGFCTDFDRNGDVDFTDFTKIASSWLARWGSENYDAKTNFNEDDIVDNKDLCVFTGEWLQTNHRLGHWRFDDGDGNTAIDTGTGGNDGTLVGDTAWVLDDPNRGICLDFDGVGDYVKTADTTNGLDFAPNSFSVSVWINAEQVTGDWRNILEYNRGGQNWFGMWLSSGGNFHFRVGSDTKNSNQTLNADQWYLLTAVYDSTDGEMRLYIDGQFDSSITQSSGFTSPIASKLTIGVRNLEDDEYFDGRIDDVRIYNAALESEEVQALFSD